MKSERYRWIMLLVTCTVLMLSHSGYADNRKLMSVNAAKADAQRAIVESVSGLKVRSEANVQDMVAQDFTIEAKASASIKGIEFTDIVYDPDKDIAKATAQIKVGNVINVIGKKINYGDITIERVGFGTATPENADSLKALRAATVHAYQQLAEKMVGLQVDSKTTVKDYVLQSDEIKTSVMAGIWGAKVTDFGWESDGNAYMKLSLKPNYLKDILGQKFTGDLPEVTAEGNGSPTDSLKEGGRTGGSGGVREGSLGIPAAKTAVDTGGAAVR